MRRQIARLHCPRVIQPRPATTMEAAIPMGANLLASRAGGDRLLLRCRDFPLRLRDCQATPTVFRDRPPAKSALASTSDDPSPLGPLQVSMLTHGLSSAFFSCRSQRRTTGGVIALAPDRVPDQPGAYVLPCRWSPNTTRQWGLSSSRVLSFGPPLPAERQQASSPSRLVVTPVFVLSLRPRHCRFGQLPKKGVPTQQNRAKVDAFLLSADSAVPVRGPSSSEAACRQSSCAEVAERDCTKRRIFGRSHWYRSAITRSSGTSCATTEPMGFEISSCALATKAR